MSGRKKSASKPLKRTNSRKKSASKSKSASRKKSASRSKSPIKFTLPGNSQEFKLDIDGEKPLDKMVEKKFKNAKTIQGKDGKEGFDIIKIPGILGDELYIINDVKPSKKLDPAIVLGKTWTRTLDTVLTPSKRSQSKRSPSKRSPKIRSNISPSTKQKISKSTQVEGYKSTSNQPQTNFYNVQTGERFVTDDYATSVRKTRTGRTFNLARSRSPDSGIYAYRFVSGIQKK